MPTFRNHVLPSDPVAVRAIIEATAMFRPNEVDVAVELVDERLNKGEASGYHFVFAEEEGRVIGYACFGHISITLHSYDLYWLVVEPVRQGRGLGTSLLAQAEQRIAQLGGRQIFIDTSGQAIYEATRRFYLRCQYEVVAKIPEFYAPGDDKWVYMRKVGNANP